MFWRVGPPRLRDGNVSLGRGHHARRRHDHNWTELPAHSRPLSASSGPSTAWTGASTDRSSTATWTRCGSEYARTERCNDLNERSSASAEGAEALGWSSPDDVRSTIGDLHARAGRLSRLRRPVGQQAQRGSHLARRRAGARRALPDLHPRRPSAHGGRPGGSRAPGGLADAGRTRCQGDREGAARGRRLWLARVAAAAASLRHRRSGGRPEPAAASVERRRRRLRHRPGGLLGAAARRGSATSSPRRAEVKVFYRDRASTAPGLIGPATPWISGQDQQAADGRSSAIHRDLHLAHPRDRAAGSVGVDANGEAVPALFRRHAPPGEPEARDPRCRSASTRVPGATRSGHSPRARPPSWGDDLVSFIACVPRIPFRAGGHKVQRTSDGHLAHGVLIRTLACELHDTRGVWIG